VGISLRRVEVGREIPCITARSLVMRPPVVYCAAKRGMKPPVDELDLLLSPGFSCSLLEIVEVFLETSLIE